MSHRTRFTFLSFSTAKASKPFPASKTCPISMPACRRDRALGRISTIVYIRLSSWKMLFHDEHPVMAISVAGGDMQDQAAIQVILNSVEFGMSPEEAFKAPRFSTTHFINSFGQERADLGSLSVPNTLPEIEQADLRARGHVVTVSSGGVGGVALISIDPKTRQATAVGPAAEKIN